MDMKHQKRIKPRQFLSKEPKMDIKHQNVVFGPEECQEGAASVAPYTGGLHRRPGGNNILSV